MCGIVGVLGDQRGVDTPAMLSALGHRGPDGAGEFRRSASSGPGLWLGHTRLAIIDLSPAGAQPMQSASGRYSIVFNGEIYNFQQLRSTIAARGWAFRGHSDTEVILALVETLGLDAALERLRGMFAFALWDEQEQTLALARDRLGEKPLYFAELGDRFVFASEVRTLLASGVVERQLDPDGLEAFLTFGAVADPRTLVRGVRALEAGTCAIVRRYRASARRYWRLGEDRSEAGVTRDEALAHTRLLLTQAEERCMVADVPVGVLLSGGIDSSANVTLLALAGHRNLQTFSVTFPSNDVEFDEAPYSRLVAEKNGTQHHEMAVGLDDARQLVPKAVAAMDQPTHDGVNTYIVCDAIRRAGIKVAVSGQGADELFLGYPQRRLFPWLEGVARTLGPTRRLLRRFPLGRLMPEDSRLEKILQMGNGADAARSAYLVGYSVFSQAAIERLRKRVVASPTRFVESAGGARPLDRLSRMQTVNYLRNVLLRDGDQMSMAHGIELRAPFVDSDLVQTVATFPCRYKVERKRNKPLLLDAVGPALPRQVWDRPKQGFALPYARWLREGLRVADLSRVELGLDREELATVEARFRAGEHPTRFWALQVLAAWAESHRMGSRWL